MTIGHRSSNDMARCLVSYIACDKRVRSEVLAEFLEAPQLKTIAKMREHRAVLDARAVRGRQADGYLSQGWDWRPDLYEASMEVASRNFVTALQQEARRR